MSKYREYHAVSYSSFKNWLNNRAISEFSESIATSKGKMFEQYLEAMAAGKSTVTTIKASDTNFMNAFTDRELKLNKSGELDKRSSAYNDVVDCILKNEAGDVIIPDAWENDFNKMLTNIAKSEVTLGEYAGLKGSFLAHGKYQVERYGDLDGTPIKAKYDIIHENDDEYGEIIIDLKTTSDLSKFRWQYRDGYYIQDYLYSHLSTSDRLIFMVVETKEPFNVMYAMRFGEFTAYQMSQLWQIKEYWEWKQSGAEARGYLDTLLI